MLLLNNKYTSDLFCNKNLAAIVWKIYDPTKVKGKGGTINTKHKDIVKWHGKVWFDEKSITKILTLRNITCKFRVTYDFNNYGVFTFHNRNNKYTHFNMCKDELHYHDTKNCRVALFQTVSENELV